MPVETPMPKYRCHKEVWALKIAAVTDLPMPTFASVTCRGAVALGTACGHCAKCKYEKMHGPMKARTLIQPDDWGYAPFEVSADYVAKHKPVAGGYFVQYADGYLSFSPAAAFEEGYTRIP